MKVQGEGHGVLTSGSKPERIPSVIRGGLADGLPGQTK